MVLTVVKITHERDWRESPRIVVELAQLNDYLNVTIFTPDECSSEMLVKAGIIIKHLMKDMKFEIAREEFVPESLERRWQTCVSTVDKSSTAGPSSSEAYIYKPTQERLSQYVRNVLSHMQQFGAHPNFRDHTIKGEEKARNYIRSVIGLRLQADDVEAIREIVAKELTSPQEEPACEEET